MSVYVLDLPNKKGWGQLLNFSIMKEVDFGAVSSLLILGYLKVGYLKITNVEKGSYVNNSTYESDTLYKSTTFPMFVPISLAGIAKLKITDENYLISKNFINLTNENYEIREEFLSFLKEFVEFSKKD